VAYLREAYGLGHVSADALEADATARVLAEISLNGRALPGVRAVLEFREATWCRGCRVATARCAPAGTSSERIAIPRHT